MAWTRGPLPSGTPTAVYAAEAGKNQAEDDYGKHMFMKDNMHVILIFRNVIATCRAARRNAHQKTDYFGCQI
jgi:hypothetical protein